MKRIYFYKLTTDNGGAPHVRDGVLSLAICKPAIRSTAKLGDMILGFAANSMNANNRLIFVAQVSEKLDGDDYYTATHAQRGDCIYERRDGHFVRRNDALYHDRPGDLAHDLGEYPTYPRANVLLSNRFRYFGASGSDEYKTRHSEIGEAVKSLGRSHRVEHAADLRDALWKLAEEVLEAPQSAPGTPTSAPDCGVCLRDDDDEVCVVDEDGVRTHC